MTIVAIVLGVGGLMILVELAAPGMKWNKVKGWLPRALFLNSIQIGMVFLATILWDRWFEGLALWHADEKFGTIGGGIIGYIVITFVYYWWHRARHEVDFLWRWFHQVHHSPQRIEIITSFYKHPIEILANSIISSFIVYVTVGLGPEAAALAILLSGLAELFYHWNIKTPYWLGFFFQRPESHRVHHKKSWHRSNFSDLPLWDMLFGTFDNPKKFEDKCGFLDKHEQNLWHMLRGKDVHK